MRRMIVLSADAMVGEDLAYMRTLPNFKKYLAGGAEVRRVRSIYPTVTYAAHTTLATGAYPERTGVSSNYVFQPGKLCPDWLWYHDAVRCEDLFTAAKRAKLTTAAVFWPVTGRHPDIDWLIDECWSLEGEGKRDAFLRTGTSPALMERVVESRLAGWEERSHPGADRFVIDCAAALIREVRPGLLMIHPANIDGYRHDTGLFSEKVKRGVAETDEWIGELMRAAEQAGVAEETDLVLVSDHGQMEFKRYLNLNRVLRDAGLIETDEEGNVTEWSAWSVSNGMSAAIFTRGGAAKRRVAEKLEELRGSGLYGIGEVFTAERALREQRVCGGFDFMVETDGFTSFGDDWNGPIVGVVESRDYRSAHGTHGYLPEKGPQPIFAAKGPSFRSGAVVEACGLVDIAPTLARALRASLPQAQGRALEELLT